MKLNHISIVVKNLEQAIKLYSDALGCHQPESGPYSKIVVFDELGFKERFAFLQMNDWFLELVEPIEGSRVRILQEKGEGAPFLIALRADDVQKVSDEMKKKGIMPVDVHGSPLKDKKYLVSPSGNKYFLLPPEKTGGTYFEFIEPP
jgi:catechol 2,3-dioxygenase-like lactoylglutathione lyase family enzyme